MLAVWAISSGPLPQAAERHWIDLPGGRAAALDVRAGPRSEGFTRLPPERTGVLFTNRLSDASVARNRLVEDGAGVAAGDVDGDGHIDLYFCGTDGSNKLFRNLGGRRFEDVTERSGVACSGQWSTGAVFADVDGDGDLDLLVSGLGTGVRLFLNDGRGRFQEKLDSGLARRFGARSMALADVDGDGDLDLYVTHYRSATARDAPVRVRLTRVGERYSVPLEHRQQFTVETTADGQPVLIENGEPDLLYRNLGGGRFEPVPWTGGAFLDEEGRPLAEPPRDWGLSAMFRDLNGDGAPDLYVCNDFYSPDRIWLNDGVGNFRALPLQALRKICWASMAVDFADIDRDGRDDFFVAEMLGRDLFGRHLRRSNLDISAVPATGWGWSLSSPDTRIQVMRNTLFWNRGEGSYAEMAQLAGVEASDWTWGVAFMDVDLDGYEDLLIANGHARDYLNSDLQEEVARITAGLDPSRRPRVFSHFPALELRNAAFRNRGDRTFEDRSADWGFDWKGISNGMALADLDGDGDLEVILNNLNAPAQIFWNETAASRLAVRLRGPPPNTAGIGARIRVLGGPVPQSQEVICGGRYLSGDDPMRVFAAGSGPMTVEVTWRDGRSTRLRDVQADHVYEIHYEESSPGLTGLERGLNDTTNPRESFEAPGEITPFFEDASHLLQAVHHEVEFDDQARQPLLPRKLSQNGPAVSWIDLDQDGREDLVMGSGAGGRLRVWLNRAPDGFQAVSAPALNDPASGDHAGIVGGLSGPGRTFLLIGTSGYEALSPRGSSVAGFSISFEGIERATDLDAGANPGAMALADLDGDGALDLFVAGQAVPGQYPRAEQSRIYRQERGRWVEDELNTAKLRGVGLVNGAVWSDLDGDGAPDLVLACEWGPIRVFQNRQGELVEVTANVGLDRYRGWWNGVTTADLNGDGQLEIIATNWGRNTPYQPYVRDELRLYHGEMDETPGWNILEACFDPDRKKEVPWRDFGSMTRAIPALRERFENHASYAAASMIDLFGPALDALELLKVNTLDSTVFWKRDGRFEGEPLPFLAQIAPAFAVAVGDLDGDGNEDLFLSQNFFAVDRETGRYDSGLGVWLRGDGQGGWKALSATESGVKIFGEQRGAALSDYDGDGRIDLVVTQNAGPLRLFRNQGARPGLRVRALGAEGNGIGAQLRVKYGARFGPLREIHGGSGYWSQNGAVQVLGLRAPPTALWVRWPGGRTNEFLLPSGAAEVEVDINGTLRVVR